MYDTTILVINDYNPYQQSIDITSNSNNEWNGM